MKSQQNRIEDNNNLIDKMRNDLSRASTSLTSLKGESCSTESTESVDIMIYLLKLTVFECIIRGFRGINRTSSMNLDNFTITAPLNFYLKCKIIMDVCLCAPARHQGQSMGMAGDM